MSDQLFNKEQIWEKISNDPRFPQKEPDRKPLFWFSLSMIVILLGIFSYYSIEKSGQVTEIVHHSGTASQDETSKNVPANQNAEKKIATYNNSSKTDANISTNVHSEKSIALMNKKTKSTERPSSAQLAETPRFEMTYSPTSSITPPSQINKLNQSASSTLNYVNNVLEKRKNLETSPSTINPNITNEQSTKISKIQISKLPKTSLIILDYKSPNVEISDQVVAQIKPMATDINSPYYLDFSGGLGVPKYSTQPISTDPNPTNSLQHNKYTRSYHLNVGLGYRSNQWEFEGGINMDIYKSLSDTSTMKIDYLVNEESGRIEKYRITNRYLLHQYFGSIMVNASAARTFSFGKLNVAPKLKLRYSILDLSRGSLLDTSYSVQKIEGSVFPENAISIEMGVKCSVSVNPNLSSYLELGHSQNFNYLIEDQGYLKLRSNHLKLGLNFSL